MDFLGSIHDHNAQTEAELQAIFVNSVSAVKTSIVEGSPTTGAPGQPFKTGNLANSWEVEFESAHVALVDTNVDYAEAVEDNIRGVTFHNHGPHSVKLTEDGFDRIVEDETQKLLGSNP